MRWKPKTKPPIKIYNQGDERLKKKFLFLPKCLDVKKRGSEKEYRWLCSEYIVERYFESRIYETENFFGNKVKDYKPSYWWDTRWASDEDIKELKNDR